MCKTFTISVLKDFLNGSHPVPLSELYLCPLRFLEACLEERINQPFLFPWSLLKNAKYLFGDVSWPSWVFTNSLLYLIFPVAQEWPYIKTKHFAIADHPINHKCKFRQYPLVNTHLIKQTLEKLKPTCECFSHLSYTFRFNHRHAAHI